MLMVKTPPTEIFKLISEFNKDFDNLDIVAGYRKNRKTIYFVEYIQRLQILS